MITDNQVTTANHGFAAMAEASANAKAGPAGSAGALSGFEAATPLMVAPYHLGIATAPGGNERELWRRCNVGSKHNRSGGSCGAPFRFRAVTAATALQVQQ